MNRRSFLRASGTGLAVTPFLIAGELLKPDRRKLGHVRAGAVMSASSWNELVDRVNELSRR